MSVSLRGVARRPVTELSTGNQSILDRFGGPELALAAEFHPSVRACVGELIAQLKVCCGSLVQGSLPKAYMPTSPAGWRTLREVSVDQIVYAVRRTERSFPDFVMPGSDAQSVHARLEYLLTSGGRR